MKNQVKKTKGVTIRKLSSKLEISRTSVQRILKDDLHLWPYKKIKEPLLTDDHKINGRSLQIGCSNCDSFRLLHLILYLFNGSLYPNSAWTAVHDPVPRISLHQRCLCGDPKHHLNRERFWLGDRHFHIWKTQLFGGLHSSSSDEEQMQANMKQTIPS